MKNVQLPVALAKREGEHIIGDMLRRAREHKLQAPLLRLAYCHLQAYEARQSKA